MFDKNIIIWTFEPQIGDDINQIAQKVCNFARSKKAEAAMYFFDKKVVVGKRSKPRQVVKAMSSLFHHTWRYNEHAKVRPQPLGPHKPSPPPTGLTSRRSEELRKRILCRSAGYAGIR